MKQYSFLLFLFITFLTMAQKQVIPEEPTVDKRVELLSIVFRLAGNEEYNAEIFRRYTDKIEEHYAPYKDHDLIKFAQKLKHEQGVGFDAVMSMAISLDQDFNPKVPFSETIPDKRWGKENAHKFVELLKKFYKDSNSEDFFLQNSKLYRETASRFNKVYAELDLDWYKNFYGKEPNEKFHIISSLGNGGGNYGPSINLPNGKREVYAIMGTWKTDSTGMAQYTIESHFPTLLHEFNHSFVNYLLDQDPEPFRENGEVIYSVVKEKMQQGAYSNWETMLNEALVRAAVIKYMKDHHFSEKEISIEIIEQLNRGFIWIEDLVQELEIYDANRNKYSTLENYMPQLAKAYTQYAKDISHLAEKAEQEKARFKSLKEFENGETNIDPLLKQITINFDKPFAGTNFIRPGEEGKFPDFRNIEYSEDRRSVRLDWVLESNTQYQFFLIGLAPGVETKDLEISFKTR